MTKNTKLDRDGVLVVDGWVESLDPGEIFVFGSNAQGRHGGGAARIAMDRFGAVYGQGHGLQGRSYGIDTMTDEKTMAAEIAGFLAFARAHTELMFLVTEIGCGIGPYRPRDVAPYFSDAPSNVALPESFVDVLRAAGGIGPSPTSLSSAQLDRAVGAIVGSAAGDALGSQYEFGPSHPDDFIPEFGVGPFGHDVGEWTDDTAMAIPILEALARGDSLRDAAALIRHAIAGSLAGALWGATQVPPSWQRRLHGWPGYRVDDLSRLAIVGARRGTTD